MKVLPQKLRSIKNPQIVVDGQQRAHAALLSRVRVEVEREYEQKTREAKTLWQCWRLHWEIEREIRRRLQELAPNEALYLKK